MKNNKSTETTWNNFIFNIPHIIYCSTDWLNTYKLNNFTLKPAIFISFSATSHFFMNTQHNTTFIDLIKLIMNRNRTEKMKIKYKKFFFRMLFCWLISAILCAAISIQFNILQEMPIRQLKNSINAIVVQLLHVIV